MNHEYETIKSKEQKDIYVTDKQAQTKTKKSQNMYSMNDLYSMDSLEIDKNVYEINVEEE